MKIKKTLALLTSTAMLLTSLNVSAFAAGSGDVNSDGSVTKADADLTMEYVLNPANLEGETFDAEAADVTDCHGVSAKDVAMILQMAAKGTLPEYIYVTAGKIGGKVFQPVDWDGATKDDARLSAQDELESISVDDFFDNYFGDVDNTTRVDQVNNFLDKVYLNDYKLTDSACEAWLLDIVSVTGNSELTTFITDFYTALDGDLTIEEAKNLFYEFNDVTITDADIDAIEANYTDFGWFRTNFQVVVYDADTYSDSTTVMKHYDDHYSNYGIDVVDWYFFNNSEVIPRIADLEASGFIDYADDVYTKYSSPTTQQPFRDNVIATLRNIVKPYLDVVNADGTVKEALDAIGGDRIEFTINTGTLPNVVDKGDTIDSYEKFVEEFGTWDDPCTTYYIDFSQVGYDFSSGSGSSDVTTTEATEASTEATSEATTTSEETTTTEAETESATETETESTTEAAVSGDTYTAAETGSIALGTVLLSTSNITVTSADDLTVKDTNTESEDNLLAVYGAGTNDVRFTSSDGDTIRPIYKIDVTTAGTLTVTADVNSTKKIVLVKDDGSYTVVTSYTNEGSDKAEGYELSAAVEAGTYYFGGVGTNVYTYSVSLNTGSSEATTEAETESATETETESATEAETESATEAQSEETTAAEDTGDTYTASAAGSVALNIVLLSSSNIIVTAADALTIKAVNDLFAIYGAGSSDVRFASSDGDTIRPIYTIQVLTPGTLTVTADINSGKKIVLGKMDESYTVVTSYTNEGTEKAEGYELSAAVEAGTYYFGGVGTNVYTYSVGLTVAE